MATMTDPQAARRGRPPRIDRATILAAARGIPVGDLSMAELARALDVTPAALYHYFPNRDAVYDALAADLLDGVAVPDLDLPWARFLEALAHNLRARLLESAWTVELTGRTQPISAGLRLVDRCLQVLIGAGFEPRTAMRATQVLVRFTTMAAVLEATAQADRQQATLVALSQSDPDAVATIVDHLDTIGPLDADAEFGSQLACVLAGIATLAPPETT